MRGKEGKREGNKERKKRRTGRMGRADEAIGERRGDDRKRGRVLSDRQIHKQTI